MILFIPLHQILFLIPPGRSNVMSSFNVQHFSFAMVNEVQILLMLLQNVKYRARLKSNRSLAGSDRVRQKGLGFNL
jgi:hypothetical protein